jgi:hypothetical protein
MKDEIEIEAGEWPSLDGKKYIPRNQEESNMYYGKKSNVFLQNELGQFERKYMEGVDPFQLDDTRESFGKMVVFGTAGEIKEDDIKGLSDHYYSQFLKTGIHPKRDMTKPMTPAECYNAEEQIHLPSLQEIQSELNINLVSDILAIDKLKHK